MTLQFAIVLGIDEQRARGPLPPRGRREADGQGEEWRDDRGRQTIGRAQKVAHKIAVSDVMVEEAIDELVGRKPLSIHDLQAIVSDTEMVMGK
jgi:hypothetical protein